jgi:hypothetical protein
LVNNDRSHKRSASSVFFPGRNAVIYFLLALTNSLFVWKYAGRHGLALAAILYFLVFLLFAKYLSIHPNRTEGFFNRERFIWFLAFIGFLAILAVYLVPAHSRVARLPAIEEWVGRLLHGQFPYGGSTNASGFPVLFLVALPFYFAGNIGLLEVIGILLFGILILEVDKFNIRASWSRLLILVLLPTVYYEVITRSELFFNMSLALALIIVTDKYLNVHKNDSKFFISAIGFGLVLSTRLIVAPLYAIFVIYKFKKNIVRGVVFSVTVILIFALTLLPFLLWNSDSFISQGPFRMQFAYLPEWGVVVIFFASIVFGFMSREIRDVSAFAGITIFCAVALAFLWAVYQIGITQVVSKDGFDIGYFILSAPFLLLGLRFDDAEDVSLSDHYRQTLTKHFQTYFL